MESMTCEDCGGDRVVLAQYGVNLASLGLGGRFCGSCLRPRLTENLGEDPYAPTGQPLIEETD